MNEIVILDTIRTPFGKYKGSLAALSAVDLGVDTVKTLLTRNPGTRPDSVIFGNVLSAGLGQNIARQISIHAGLAPDIPAFTVNEVCGSSLKAIQLARQALLANDAEVILAGGTESMTNAETMHIDGLTDAFENVLMGVTVERLAAEYGITREAQELFAIESHRRAAHTDFAAELTQNSPLETIRTSTPEKMASLAPVFAENGTITAGTASPVNDGASAMLLSTRAYAQKHGLRSLAVLRDVVEVGVEPARMGISPIKAIQKLSKKTGVTLAEIDRFEINEAFAASSLIINQELGLNAQKVNRQGGALALGHPLGATGARLIGTLAHQLYTSHERLGIASLCIGGGLGLAALLENPNA
ncbi:MAG: thiolase family protein [Streptococcaceae bacterium]|jgi:acetyl-CoA C-acetyltransferase|nr:thiolase family protein [Streptococcaceae bacterium]